MGELQERITTTRKGSITSVQAIYVPADDLTDPAPATAFAHLDATTVLSRQIAELGIYPAVDPLDSTSRILDPRSRRRGALPGRTTTQRILQRYKELQDIIAILGMDELSEDDKPRRLPRPQDPEASCRSRSTSPRRSPARRASTSSSPTPSSGFKRAGVGQVRPPAGAGLLHGRHDRGGGREGKEARRRGRVVAMKVILLIVGLVIGGAAGWFTAPRAVDVDVGGLSVQVDGNQDGGALVSAEETPGGGVEISVGRRSMLDDRNTRTAIFAAIGGLIGLIIGFVADRRRTV
jgi:hypothetical protein